MYWKVLERFWSFGLFWEAKIYSQTLYKDGHTGMEHLIGDRVDISEWNYFGYYDLCQYWDKQTSVENQNIGRWLGVLNIVGRAL